MTDATVLQMLNEMLICALKVSGPILGTALVVGVLISILQAATQVQEMTLTYVPKMLAVAVVVALLGPWMLHALVDFASGLLGHLENFVH